MANQVEETQIKDINTSEDFSLALEFKALLAEVESHYPGLILHSNVLWLSRGKVLSRFESCLNETRTFLEIKNAERPELSDTEWLLKCTTLWTSVSISTSSM